MNDDIPGVDRSHVAEWALAQMYRSMRLAEQAFESYRYNKNLIATSSPGDRLIPRKEDLDLIAGDNQMHVRNANMYASIFTALELADESPHRKKYQAAIEAVGRSLAEDLIPRQRRHEAN